MRKNSKKASAREATPKTTRRTRKAARVPEQPQVAASAAGAPSAQEKAQEDEAAAKAHSKLPMPVLVKAGKASIETVVSEAVGCHFVCEAENAPKQGFILELETLSGKAETVKLVARYVKETKKGTLVMAFLPKLSQTMKKRGAISQMPILAKAKGEACRVSWDVDQLADDLEATILDFLGTTKEPVHVDQIIEKTEKEAAKVLAALMVLEVRKLVRQLPGKKYELAK